MTREEAKKHLEEWKEVISNSHRKKVIDMAIEAMSEPSGDLISREDEIRWVKTECNPYGMRRDLYAAGLDEEPRGHA